MLLPVATEVVCDTSSVYPSVDGSLTQSWFRRGDSVDSCLFPACVRDSYGLVVGSKCCSKACKFSLCDEPVLAIPTDARWGQSTPLCQKPTGTVKEVLVTG